jgi:hypothetical protein
MPPIQCQTNKGVDSGAKVCDKNVQRLGLYCKGCRERMMANGTWTEAHAKHQSELNALVNEKNRAYRASLSVEKKEARRRQDRDYRSRNRDARNAAQRQRLANMKLDPIKYEAFRQKGNQRYRKHKLKLKAERERKRARASADDDDDDDDEKSTNVQSVIPGDHVIVISDDEDEGGVEVADDSSGSDVEGIEFVSSDDEQCLEDCI